MPPINYAPRYGRGLSLSDWVSAAAIAPVVLIVTELLFYIIGA